MTDCGDVAALVADDGRRFEADLFVDASGFGAVIIERALGEPHRSFADNLFNDSAVVAPTPRPEKGPDVCTRAFAKSAGWIWQIPLTNRYGNGYVYSSKYIDKDAAALELKAHLELADETEVRHLNMRCGRVERSWVRNCLAIGLAQGFLEPLEATALHIVMVTIGGFVRAVETAGTGEETRAGLNRTIAERYEGIRDYLVCHYRTAVRADTDYWRAATKHDLLSDSLKGVMTAWFTGGDLAEEIALQKIGAFYNPVSWHCMLAGYGNFPAPERLTVPPADAQIVDMDQVDRFIDGCASNFPTHAEVLARLQEAA
jgi:hypothetical protein